MFSGGASGYVIGMDGLNTLCVMPRPACSSPALPLAGERQQTLARAVSCTGVGVHSGALTSLTIRPAPVGSGITFIRSDLSGDNRIPVAYDVVVDTRMCTAIANKAGARLSTVEHVMAALMGCGIDNAEILVNGPEVPIMDGSSADFVELIEDAGLTAQTAPRRHIRVLKTVRVEEADKWVSLAPAAEASFAMEIEFASAAIGQQSRQFTLFNGNFAHELSEARTFGFMHEVEQLRALGLGKGGSLENAIIIEGDKILNEGGLRYSDEFVRHKLLDAVGDLAMAGAPVLGAYRAHKGGHALNNRLLRALFADPANWEWA